jgi:hypothetical protein
MTFRLPSLFLAALLLCASGAQASAGAGSPFSECVRNTGGSAVVIIPAAINPTVNGKALADGDEIALFTPDEICAGHVTWSGANTAFAVWADDFLSDERDGFREGEPLSFRLWTRADGRLHGASPEDSVIVAFDASETFLDTGSEFDEGSIYMLASLHFATGLTSEPEIVPSVIAIGMPYPNPYAHGAHEQVQIPVTHADGGEVQVEVYDLLGRRVTRDRFFVGSGAQQIAWSVRDDAGVPVPAGRYFVRVLTAGLVETRTVTVAR